jgi:hypothetical protein
MSDLRKFIKITIKEFLNEQTLHNLILYRGVTKEFLTPKDKKYNFFSKDKHFAEDYGKYVWECTFKPVNIFISNKLESIQELYDNGFKLRDTFVEENWEYEPNDIKELYDYDEIKSLDERGYKSAQHTYKSRYINTDSWNMIENTDGVLEYILSKYDGVELSEGGLTTYYLRTDKIVNFKIKEK